MKHRLTGLIFVAALLGACSHAELRKMFHGEPERRVQIITESPMVALEKLRALKEFEALGAKRLDKIGNRRVASISAGWLHAMRLRPLIGRAFLTEEERSGAVAMLSSEYWMEAYGKDPAIIGRTVELGEKTFTYVGVLPDEANIEAQVFIPGKPSADGLKVIGLLRPGVSIKQAQATADRAGVKARLETFKAEW